MARRELPFAITSPPPMPSTRVLQVRVDETTYERATDTLVGWAKAGESRSVVHANVHVVMEAHDDPGFAEAVNGADLVTADGMPLVWAQRLKAVPRASRVYGPTLMLHLLRRAAREHLPVGFYGGSDRSLELMAERFRRELPALELVFSRSPPFSQTPGSYEDDEAIRASGARLLFVGLGCPKQEWWMAERRGKLPCVMLGVGAAFDFHAGLVRQAPSLLQSAGLEWAFRLAVEPRRLFKRYAKHNPRFVALLLKELARGG